MRFGEVKNTIGLHGTTKIDVYVFVYELTDFELIKRFVDRKNVVLLFLVIFSLVCSTAQKSSIGQDSSDYISSGYYEAVYKADSLFIEQDAAGAFELLHRIFQKKTPLNRVGYFEFKTYVSVAYLTGHIEIASSGLQQLITKHGLTWEGIIANVILTKIADEDGLNRLEFEKLYQKYQNAINYKLREEIKEMLVADQLYRGGDKNRFLENLKSQDSIDHLNALKLKHIFETYGYPEERMIGRSTMEDKARINTILLHLKDSIRNTYFIPKLWGFVKEGTCDPYLYGAVVDRFTTEKPGNAKVYGIYHGHDPNLFSLKQLNKNRKSIGLPPYGYEGWRHKVLYGSSH